jgi:hypothetical protein
VEGDIGVRDRVETLVRHPARIPVAEITRVYASDRDDLATMERLVALDALPEDWRSHFQKKLAENGEPNGGQGRSALRAQPIQPRPGSGIGPGRPLKEEME